MPAPHVQYHKSSHREEEVATTTADVKRSRGERKIFSIILVFLGVCSTRSSFCLLAGLVILQPSHLWLDAATQLVRCCTVCFSKASKSVRQTLSCLKRISPENGQAGRPCLTGSMKEEGTILTRHVCIYISDMSFSPCQKPLQQSQCRQRNEMTYLEAASAEETCRKA